MDRLNQLRAGAKAGRAGDATLDTSSPPSEAYMSANESSKYFSLSDSTFDITPIKDVSLASAASAVESDHTMIGPEQLLSNLSPITKKDVMLDSFKIGKQIDAANILSGGVDIFEDNDNSFDGNELVIDDNVEMDDKTNLDEKTQLEEAVSEGTLVETHVDVASKDTEVVLQIDGKNVDAIDIGNGLYLYRKAGQEELAAVQIITEDNAQAPSFKFLKVRENAEGNLEVYEEFEIEVSKDVPVNEAKPSTKKTPHITNKDITCTSSNIVEKKDKTPPKQASTSKIEEESENELESKTEFNLNGKMKFNESRKSPVVGSFTPMTFHSTPNKEGKPLTKTMVDQQLDPSRHSDNVKKTIEVHTDSQTKKLSDESYKQKSESQMKSLIENMIIKELSAECGTKEENTKMSSQDQPELSISNDDGSTTPNASKTVHEKAQGATDEETTSNVNDLSSKSIELPKDKSHEKEAGLSKNLEVEINDFETEKYVLSKPKKHIAPEFVEDIVRKNLINNQIIEANNDKTAELNNSEDKTDNISVKDDGNDLLNKDINKAVVESTKPKTNTLDQALEKSTENKQKLDNKSHEINQDTVSTKDIWSVNKEAIKQDVIIPHEESPATINEVCTSSLSQTQTLQPTVLEVQNLIVDDKNKEEENRTLAASSVPTATKLEIISKQVKETGNKEHNTADKVKDTEEKAILEAEQSAKIAEPKTEVKEQPINAVAQVNEANEVTKLSFQTKTSEPELTLSVEKTNQTDNKIEPREEKSSLVTKGIDSIKASDVEKFDPVAKTDSQPDELNQVAKPVDQPTVLKTEKLNPISKVETKPLTPEINVREKKLESKVSQTNKSIPVIKGVELKTLSKPVLLNPIEKKVEVASAPQTFKIIADPKVFDSKTYSKTEKSLLPKVIEARTASKPEMVAASKGFELKTIPKTVLLNPVHKVIVPKPFKIEKVSVAPQITKSNAVIITSNKIIAPSRVMASNSDTKPINNNHTAVPFGKWTDANRQEFLNKFKDIKVPATSNSKQIKNSNDLNRIDVLKKIDSQRSNTASAKAQDKLNVKDTVFSTKIAPPKTETKIPVKNEGLKMKIKPVDSNNTLKTEDTTGTVSSTVIHFDTDIATPEPEERREVNVNDLIGKAIVGMLNRPVAMPMTRSPLDEPRQVDIKEPQITLTETNTDQQSPLSVVDQPKPSTEQQKIKTDKQKLNVDQQKPTIDQQQMKADQRKQNAEQQKLLSDQQQLKGDQRKQNTCQQKLNIDQQKLKTDQRKQNQQKSNIEQKNDEDSSGSLDDIEMKMNELHGIPFVERPPHELPRVYKTYSKSSKNENKGVKKVPPATSKNLIQENVIELESDEEVIEHEPITGDVDLTKKTASKLPAPIKAYVPESKTAQGKESRKKDAVITENDFDKFARRNSITFEDCLTVKFDGKEPANVVQTVKEKDVTKVYPRNEMIGMETMTKLPQKQTSNQTQPNKISNTKFGPVPEDPNNKNYQSKIHTAYQSAITAKLQMDRPITIIEDKPVKVVFMDANSEFVPNQLNVQGKELSPAKKTVVEPTKVSPQTVTDSVEDKQQDDIKAKSKHQRKQVLTPVEAPDLELIQPRDLELDVSPKKKRKTDDNKPEKSLKNLVPKKSYLLGRIDEKIAPQDPVNETINRADTATERTVSAIDSLVKAAELLENQSVQSASSNTDSQQNTPVKRGRGRPRKYPLPEGATPKVESPSPQKKPRLIDAKPIKRDLISDDESIDEEQMVRENWTMGKINEDIVCPICNKLFRSENVVFKHVKHCTGVSPTRSDLEKRSPRRRRYSRDSDKSFESISDDMHFDEKPKESVKSTHKKRKSKESVGKPDEVDIIVIEDTPVKQPVTEKQAKSRTTQEKQETIKIIQGPTDETKDLKGKPQNVSDEKPIREKTLKEIADEKYKAKKLEDVLEDIPAKAKKLTKTTEQRSSNLVCELCGKTFRQLSYLANHKLQHKKEQLKKLEAKLTAKLQVFSCEVCKKEFRMLHHLVQHRIIHNPEEPARSTRKSSSEQSDTKVKEQPAPRQTEDTSAGFRCEPCDKSFRKLHHLVEHRETHDGINRQKTNIQTVAPPIEKPPPPPQCDVCKKSFRKLHHLIEHKEQHHVEQVETSSEKSDDKSIQSSLSTRDIIHECSLCYMVFPNEHSLNKHFVICQQKKKRQSKAKDKTENIDGVDIVEESTVTDDSMNAEDVPKIVVDKITDVVVESNPEIVIVPKKAEEKIEPAIAEKATVAEKSTDIPEVPASEEKKVAEIKSAPAKRVLPKSDDAIKDIPEKIKKIDDEVKKETSTKEIPKKIPVKDKVAPAVTKRQKSIAPLPVLPEGKSIESSDDDEVKYMLNPNFKTDETSEGKVFMQVRSNKRNSLQIERPNSRDLINRRTSLQHPPKILRLKAKAVEPKVVPTTKNVPKPKQEASTDSDDSDVKYSFPQPAAEEPKQETPKERKTPRKSIAEKRKSLSGIAKRKSAGLAIAKLKVNPPPVRIIKRRTLDVEHRCDCGQLFNSAALLSRHTSLAHTPPRIRRRRSPPPDPPQPNTRKSSVRSEASHAKPTRKSSVKSDALEARESQEKSSAKPRRSAAHRGVPVPDKMRKMMMKNAK